MEYEQPWNMGNITRINIYIYIIWSPHPQESIEIHIHSGSEKELIAGGAAHRVLSQTVKHRGFCPPEM